ncbi:zinc-binding dehydrogenase [Streptomyces sp. SID4985]|uniref:zinc-binding dehydrogenase n=1 Tax=Streptomyces sp. SID4985 TaxID=2690292 RepID=UPI001367AF75|nr:zinc-binding dehydrogenase [Streptomyces sp. SID4985]MYQ46601.1 zinc-binding dehydrogenase [Streptomyces sp. SID4985]
MHAVRLHSFGPPENLVHEKTEDPVPGPGQVRIAVAAAGVHLLDTALREGRRGPLPALPELPTVPGREVAGVVDALGDGTDASWLGRRVVAHLGPVPGGYAELAVTDTDRLHEIPANLDFAAAVAMIGTGRTALGIAGFAEPGADDVVVVPAAAGGIGTLLVQHAKNAGATVVGLAGGPEKTARVRANGADLAVDYTAPGWPDEVRAFLAGRPATLVYDGVGGEAAREAVALLGPGGRHLVFGWSAEGIGDEARGHFVEGVSASVLGPEMLRRAGGLRALEERALDEAARGRLRPAVTRLPLSGAAAAHRALQTRGTVGKVVLEP